MPNLPAVVDADFASKVLNGPRPVALEFWAEWWGGCHAIAPVVEDAARRWAGKVDVYALNTDDAPETSAALGIMGIPAILFFKGGKEVGRMVGGNKTRLEEHLKALAS